MTWSITQYRAEVSQQFCVAAVPAKKALTVFGRENVRKIKYTWSDVV